VPSLSFAVVVAGELGDRFDGVFAGLSLAHVAGTTRISGAHIDQAELEGLLRQVFELGLQILSVSTSPVAADVQRKASISDS
jgi:hypothetical protein